MTSPRRVLVVGSGGREHALAWRLARDPGSPDVRCAPGNAGMARAFPCDPVAELDPAALVELARARSIDLVVVGPEAPLAAGVGDSLAAAGIAVFGPGREAARLESSKWFAKEVMLEAGVPTARAELFEDAASARAALGRFEPPYVLKVDGLAAGKGVRVAHEREAAEAFLSECLEGGRFGAGGRRVLLEEFLEGEELSVMAVCDGRRFLLLPSARDYKRAYDGDRGPNTGGMGAWAPSPLLDAGLAEEVGASVVGPVLEAMERRGTPYRGLLYAGLMVGASGLRVLEFNARFGDPETEAVLPLVEGDLSALLAGAAAGRLDPATVSTRPGAAVSVALVDDGYPDAVRGGGRLDGLDALMAREDLLVFHAATERRQDGWWVRGGRAAFVTAWDQDLERARARAYLAIAGLGGEGWRYRRDVAARAPESAAGRTLGAAGAGGA